MNQSGQTLLILLLSTLVALTIGLAITQRTLTDVATSTKGEQSSRAYSAAEAGIQKIYNSTDASLNLRTDYLSLDNQATADVASTGLIPTYSAALSPQPGLEYPPIDKTSFAQFWLVKPDDVTNWIKTSGATGLPPFYYPTSVDLYFGNPDVAPSDRPAIEMTIISFRYGNPNDPVGSYFVSDRKYYDAYNRNNGFANQNCNVGSLFSAVTYNTNGSFNAGQLVPTTSQFFCHATVPLTSGDGITPVLVRLRVLYSETAQKIALVPTCGDPTCALPPQAIIYYSKGKSGQSQHQLKLFTLKNAVPFAFDFSLFAAGSINK